MKKNALYIATGDSTDSKRESYIIGLRAVSAC